MPLSALGKGSTANTSKRSKYSGDPKTRKNEDLSCYKTMSIIPAVAQVFENILTSLLTTYIKQTDATSGVLQGSSSSNLSLSTLNDHTIVQAEIYMFADDVITALLHRLLLHRLLMR